MRLDKYLKVSRLIKRRTVANEACEAGRGGVERFIMGSVSEAIVRSAKCDVLVVRTLL